jgi:hypothetical protein
MLIMNGLHVVSRGKYIRGFDSLHPLACLAGNVDAGTEAHRSRSAADEKVLSATGNEEPLSRLRSVKFRERGFLRDLKIGQRPHKFISRRSRRFFGVADAAAGTVRA